METKVTREFQGYINSIEFNDSYIFNTTREALEEIVSIFGEVFTDEFISDLGQAIKRCMYYLCSCLKFRTKKY